LHGRNLIVVAFIALFSGNLTGQPVIIHLSGGKAHSVTIHEAILEHYPGHPDSVFHFKITLEDQTTPLIGTAEWMDAGIQFTPLWAFSPGLRYNIHWNNRAVTCFEIPASESDPPEVNFYPRADTLPENLLKIYLFFSGPMSEGQAHNHVRILNDRGDTLNGVFLDLRPELWNEDRTLLTLWLDPGRIKRELILNREMGAPLQAGQHYRVVVLPGWRDRLGTPTRQLFSKSFYAGQADRTKPDANTWQITAPAAGTLDPLAISFDETIDYTLAMNAIHVHAGKQMLKGTVKLDGKAKTWHFVPDRPWHAGNHTLIIENRLEDLAGNNLDRLFDSDLHHNESALVIRERIFQRKFRIR
jgi:hypothetical protein